MAQGTIAKPYATYDWYTSQYFGTAITEVEFPRYARQASYLVDRLTAGNMERKGLTEATLPDCVRDAVCAAAEILQRHRNTADNPIRSESNDGYSVSYADAKAEQQAAADATAEIRQYLANSGLLFRGVFPLKEPPDDD